MILLGCGGRGKKKDTVFFFFLSRFFFQQISSSVETRVIHHLTSIIRFLGNVVARRNMKNFEKFQGGINVRKKLWESPNGKSENDNEGKGALLSMLQTDSLIFDNPSNRNTLAPIRNEEILFHP